MAIINTTEVALSLPLSLDSSGNLVTVTSQEKIWADRVRIALGTRFGERVMRPTYGSEIGASLFNTVAASSDIISKEVFRVFHEQFTLLTLINVTPEFNEETNNLTITISYELPNKTEITTEVGIVTISDMNVPFEERP